MTGIRCWAAFGLAALLATMALAQEKPAAEKAAAKIDPKAAEIVRSVSDFYKGLNSLSVDVSQSVSFTIPGMKRETVVSHSVSMRRPNLLAFVRKTGKCGTLMCDGKNLYAYMPITARYTVGPAPADLDALLTGTPEAAMLTDSDFLPNLLRNKPYEALMRGVQGASYAGVEEVAGVKCHHLKFELAMNDWDLWAATGEKPLVMKVTTDLAKSLAMDPRAPAGAKLVVSVEFSGWTADAQLPDDRFKFVAPDIARKSADLFAEMDEGAHPLRGKPAPDFKLDLLDGGKMTLSEHKGKNIVILDFWATWCPPCRATMPIIAEVADAYKDKGVVLYAVNEEDPTEKVREFLKDEKLSLPVALDKNGDVGVLYLAAGIPQTVIVGKDGVIQVVHVGMLPDEKKQLRADLDALLASKKPAGETPAK